MAISADDPGKSKKDQITTAIYVGLMQQDSSTYHQDATKSILERAEEITEEVFAVFDKEELRREMYQILLDVNTHVFNCSSLPMIERSREYTARLFKVMGLED